MRRSRLPGFSAYIMAVIESVVTWPIRPRLGELESGRQERIIFWQKFERLHFDLRPFWEGGSGRQDHDSASDNSSDTHIFFLP